MSLGAVTGLWMFLATMVTILILISPWFFIPAALLWAVVIGLIV